MKNKKYWEERAILKDKLLEKDINKIEKKLLKLILLNYFQQLELYNSCNLDAREEN